jgi:gamma-glutamylcyclotransferase (GGCT)/AIG2-like uncharacterized protein YtfP
LGKEINESHHKKSLTQKNMKKQWLFSYGTLQDSEVQQMLFGFTCRKKNAKLVGWSLYASNESGYLFIQPETSGIVTGKIIEVDRDAIHMADQWEEVPLYQRERVLVILDDNTRQEAWVYTRRHAKGIPYSGKQLSLNDRQSVLNAIESLKKQISPKILPNGILTLVTIFLYLDLSII